MKTSFLSQFLKFIGCIVIICLVDAYIPYGYALTSAFAFYAIWELCGK